MRRLLAARGRRAHDETTVPPHAERPAAASPQRTAAGTTSARSGRRRRAVGLTLSALAIAGITAACGIDPGPPPPPSPEEAIIHEVFDPYGVGGKAVSVARCESGLNPMAGWPDSTYKGLFQLGPHLSGTVAAYGGDWFDARTNSYAARDLYLSRGNWSAWPHCGR
jgi:hypothetical protein